MSSKFIIFLTIIIILLHFRASQVPVLRKTDTFLHIDWESKSIKIVNRNIINFYD